jgi:hypothetical protein
MTEHPITPPFELVRQWSTDSPIQYNDQDWAYELFIAHHAAQWGADQELEACCEWLQDPDLNVDTYELRAARRPKPPSLKKQALEALRHAPGPDHPNHITLLAADEHALIRRALEQLDD